jgi:hypothetical protein
VQPGNDPPQAERKAIVSTIQGATDGSGFDARIGRLCFGFDANQHIFIEKPALRLKGRIKLGRKWVDRGVSEGSS